MLKAWHWACWFCPHLQVTCLGSSRRHDKCSPWELSKKKRMTEGFRKAVKGKESKHTLNGHIIHSACFFMAFFGHGVAEYLIAVSAACAFFFLFARTLWFPQPACKRSTFLWPTRSAERQTEGRTRRQRAEESSGRPVSSWKDEVAAERKNRNLNWPIRVSNRGCMHVGKFTT